MTIDIFKHAPEGAVSVKVNKNKSELRFFDIGGANFIDGIWIYPPSPDEWQLIATRSQRKIIDDVLATYPDGWPSERLGSIWVGMGCDSEGVILPYGKGSPIANSEHGCYPICTREEYEKALKKTRKTAVDAINGDWYSKFNKDTLSEEWNLVGFNFESNKFFSCYSGYEFSGEEYYVCTWAELKECEMVIEETSKVDVEVVNEPEWTHVTASEDLCRIIVKDPDTTGIIIVIDEQGRYRRHLIDSLKPIKPTITQSQVDAIKAFDEWKLSRIEQGEGATLSTYLKTVEMSDV